MKFGILRIKPERTLDSKYGLIIKVERARALKLEKVDRGWKFWIKKVEELYYPCSENKGADQLRSYCEADLCLCFHLCRLLVFPCGGSFLIL